MSARFEPLGAADGAPSTFADASGEAAGVGATGGDGEIAGAAVVVRRPALRTGALDAMADAVAVAVAVVDADADADADGSALARTGDAVAPGGRPTAGPVSIGARGCGSRP